MSEPVTALKGKQSTGAVTLRDAGLQGMITLRGNLSDAALQAICTDITGQAFPDARRINLADDRGLGWMSPDEILILLPYDGVADALARLTAALQGQHYLAENVSDARALMHLSGPYAREVLAKLTPVDLHPDSFAAGDLRRSHLGQVAAAFWMADTDEFSIICFRSVAEYLFDLLKISAKAGPVGMFQRSTFA
jgi:sarcosine oxidase subunit gamma